MRFYVGATITDVGKDKKVTSGAGHLSFFRRRKRLKSGERNRALAMSMESSTAIAQLCPNCGLCCDSTLFADVELRAGDDAKRLRRLGLTLEKKGRSKLAFVQPCACFAGKLCGIYQDRPERCRLFDCGLLKRVNAGETTADAALKKIFTAKKQAGRVRELLNLLGQRDQNAERRGELMLAVGELMTRLERDFLR